MPFQLSPGVNVSEIDLTTVVPAVSSSTAAIAGPAQWGPAYEPILVDSEDALVKRFWKPNHTNADTFFTAASFLAYSNALYFVRVVDKINAKNAVSDTSIKNGITILNDDDYEKKYENGANEVGMWAAKYAGALGNSIGVSVADGIIQDIAYAPQSLASVTGELVARINGNIDSAKKLVNGSYFALNANGEIVGDLLEDINGSTVAKTDTPIQLLRNSTDGSTIHAVLGDAIRTFSDSSTSEIVYDISTKEVYVNFNSVDHASVTGAVEDVTVFYKETELQGTGDVSASGFVLEVFQPTTEEEFSAVPFGVVDSGFLQIKMESDNFVTQVVNRDGDLSAGGGQVVVGLFPQGSTEEGTIQDIAIDSVFSGQYTEIPFLVVEYADGTGTIYDGRNEVVDDFVLTEKIAEATPANYDDWEFASLFDSRPGTSAHAASVGASGDELHVVVYDTKGLWTGVQGAVLETFPFLSKASDGRSENGTSTYYADVINRTSKFIRWMDHPVSGVNWGSRAFNETNATGTQYSMLVDFITDALAGGVDAAIQDDEYSFGYDLLASPEDIDISLLLSGSASTVIQQKLVDICESRKDCVAFLSPKREDVVGQDAGDAATAVVEHFRNVDTGVNKSSSYAVADCNWKQMYDKYNDAFRWVPMNGDVAGLCARTDGNRDPWWSPAGFNRGQVKNVVKLAYNPREAHRDLLYKNGINPVVSFRGEGVVLYGDKTLLSKPSAFDRINVRRLFIVLEKAIAIASKYSLFEFNDAFTRSQFRNMVEPFLRDVKGRRGIYDFRVVCDETNNTPEVVDRNEFIGDIYIKPAKSINFIQLNFVAVRSGVDFSEVVGQF